MHHQTVEAEGRGQIVRATRWRDCGAALALAALLSCCWATNSWAALSHLILPDPDDLMRLAQVRDWLAGQGINDWTQHRLGPPGGGAMHWSRLNDLGPAALILAARPWLGTTGAELFAVLAYPAMLFAAHLFLVARIARRVWDADAAFVALALGALAFPGTTIFSPGRIDHHALQVVLIEIGVLGMLARASLGSGALVGGIAAVSLVVGLETAPQMAALLGVLALYWVARGEAERARLAATGLALAVGTLPFLLFLRPTFWPEGLCDAFTPATASATLAGGGALALLAALTPRLPGWRARLALGAALGAGSLGGVLLAYPGCLTGPYGQVDPFLRREFIAHITEAHAMFADITLGQALQLQGLMVFALVGTAIVAWQGRRRPWRWLPLAAVVGASGAVAIVQTRGVYFGTPLSAPLLACLVLQVRRLTPPRPLLLAATWFASAGIGWYAMPYLARPFLAGGGAAPTVAGAGPATQLEQCRAPATWAAMDRYPAGVVMTSTGMAAYVIGATRLPTVAAGYHRNNAANLDLYRFFLGTPDQARPIAQRWRVRYVAFCPGDFSEIDAARRWPGSVAALLARDRTPAGWRRLALPGSQLRFYRFGD